MRMRISKDCRKLIVIDGARYHQHTEYNLFLSYSLAQSQQTDPPELGQWRAGAG